MGLAVFGDLPFTPLLPAPIAVVHVPAHRIGTTAATLLLERIKGDDQPARTIVLRHQLSAP
jgi:LacI family transcriptional regulator